MFNHSALVLAYQSHQALKMRILLYRIKLNIFQNGAWAVII